MYHPATPGRLLAAVAVCLLLGTTESKAELITFEFSTQYLNSDPSDALDAFLNPGDEIVGRFTFESLTPDEDSSSEYGHFPAAITAASIQAGSHTFELNPAGPNGIEVKNVELGPLGFANQYDVWWDITPTLGFSEITASIHLSQLFAQPGDPMLVDGDSLPLTPPDPSLANDNAWFMLSVDGQNFENSHLLPAPTIVRVPEPSTLALMVLVIIGIILNKRRKRR